MTFPIRLRIHSEAGQGFNVKLTPMTSCPPQALGYRVAHPTRLDNLFLGNP
jgi:hypothetical protein